MSELRAPDPTLTVLDCDVLIGDTTPPTAHLYEGDGGCGTVGPFEWNESAEFARWFAVPCRECFPDALPRGHVACDCGWPDHPTYPHPGLAWQVPDREAAE